MTDSNISFEETIKNTVYKVTAYNSDNAKEDLEKKILRIFLREAIENDESMLS